MKLVSRKKENLDMVSEFLERTWDMVSLKMALLGTWSKGWCSPYLDYIFYEKVPRLKSAKLKTQLRIKTSQLTYKRAEGKQVKIFIFKLANAFRKMGTWRNSSSDCKVCVCSVLCGVCMHVCGVHAFTCVCLCACIKIMISEHPFHVCHLER